MTDPAYAFFQGLERHLVSVMPAPREMTSSVADVVRESKAGSSARHKAFPEAAFLNEYALPALHDFVSRWDGMDAAKAREALLSESYRQMRAYASATPARVSRHPFGKILGITAPGIVRQWKSQNALIRSCPDLALRAPFPYRTLFEAKYFPQGKLGSAETTLATSIYQAFFYRGLARLDATETRPPWDYDYACVLAYDASEDGTLLRAWAGLRPIIGKGCWEGARIYVMIIRGSGSEAKLGPRDPGGMIN